MKDQVRPIYSELQGYLSQAPKSDKNIVFDDKAVWEIYNQTIDELNEIAGKSYDKFKVSADPAWTDGEYARIGDYRTKLSGLISKLYGEYFSDEAAPFSGMPSTIIQQSQHQSQNVQILLEVQSLIDKRLNEVTDSTEKGFLEKIKTSLASIKNVSELLSLVLSTGASMGLTIDRVLQLFKI